MSHLNVLGLMIYLDTFTHLATSLAFSVQNKRFPQPVADDIRDAGIDPRTQATGIWYDVIGGLRSTAQHNPSWTTYSTLLDVWAQLGTTFGIDEASQRDIAAAERARMCWWQSCQFHMRASDKPLLVCKGCKEARYCSLACQKK